MNSSTNKCITLSYKLYVDGDKGKELVEATTADKPFHFISGFGFALDAFEQKVTAIEKGEKFDFSLSKEEAYGDYDAQQVATVDRAVFCIDGKFDVEHVFIDAVVPLQNAEGQRFFGRVVEISDEKVKLDLNHPLAGKTLHFEGEMLENRDATEEEVKRLIAHLSGGECSCGGHCGGGHCDGGHCGGDDECSCGGHCHED